MPAAAVGRAMMGRLRSVFGERPGEPTIVECRHCGTAVEDVDVDCPACGSDEIARYRV